jgi:hypothetical protein
MPLLVAELDQAIGCSTRAGFRGGSEQAIRAVRERPAAVSDAEGPTTSHQSFTMHTDGDGRRRRAPVRCAYPGDEAPVSLQGRAAIRGAGRPRSGRSARQGGQAIQASGQGSGSGKADRPKAARAGDLTWQAPGPGSDAAERGAHAPGSVRGRRSSGRSLERPAPPPPSLEGAALRGYRRSFALVSARLSSLRRSLQMWRVRVRLARRDPGSERRSPSARGAPSGMTGHLRNRPPRKPPFFCFSAASTSGGGAP